MCEKMNLFINPAWLINIAFFIVETILIVWAVAMTASKSKSVLKKCYFAICVFALNLLLYVVPVWVCNGLLDRAGLSLFDCITSAILHFLGEMNTKLVEGYINTNPQYAIAYFVGAILAVFTTSSAAIMVFGHRFTNARKVSRLTKKRNCDIVVGLGETNLNYVKNNANAVLLIDEAVDKDYVQALIEDGYPIIKKRFSAKLLSSRYFNNKTKYNFLFFGADKDYYNNIDVVLSFLESGKPKKIYFYFEVNEKVTETVQTQIDNRCTGNLKNFKVRIRFFSKNELIARTFVEKNPITRFMPDSFLESDSSVKLGVKLKVFMLGFGDLSREVYKQFVINNQLAVYKHDTYHVFPLQYYIYDKNVNPDDWVLKGISKAISELRYNGETYVTLPDVPCEPSCFATDDFGIDFIKELCHTMSEENSLSYVIVDTGDQYRNIEIANRIKRYTNSAIKYHLFTFNESAVVNDDASITLYGDTEGILTHDIIVHESLVNLAKEINNHYVRLYNPKKQFEDEELNDLWAGQTYFNLYSNVYLANNLRLKLHLLGLDYKKRTSEDEPNGVELIAERLGNCGETEKNLSEDTEKNLSEYFMQNTKNAMLAQEHFRWNAYHLMNEFLPREKKSISSILSKVIVDGATDLVAGTTTYEIKCDGTVTVKYSPASNPEPFASVKKDLDKEIGRKDPKHKKHACIASFLGLRELSSYGAEILNQSKIAKVIWPEQDKIFNESDFNFYQNDGLLLKVAQEYLSRENYVVFRRQDNKK